MNKEAPDFSPSESSISNQGDVQTQSSEEDHDGKTSDYFVTCNGSVPA
jgi:hypothetical protein